MENTFIYTKEQVQQFLETTDNDSTNLKKALTRKGYEVKTNGKRGANLRFILDKELVASTEPTWTELFGFEPKHKSAARALLLLLHRNGAMFATDAELAYYTAQGSIKTVGHARLELAKAGYIVETKTQRKFYKELGDKNRAKHYIKSSEVDTTKVARYFGEMEAMLLEKLVETEEFLVGEELIKSLKSETMKQQIEERGAYYILYRKELAKALTPEQIEFLEG